MYIYIYIYMHIYMHTSFYVSLCFFSSSALHTFFCPPYYTMHLSTT